ncbi:MAG: exosome complex RNA-binding protein Rrp4 [Candidatus Nanoarchaeia archaeon]
MEKLYVRDRELVIPGELLAEGLEFLPSGKAYREDDKIFASAIGMVSIKGRVIKIIPLAGRYIPKKGDAIVGEIVAVLPGGWSVAINSAYAADLPLGESTTEYIAKGSDITKIFDIGDYVFCEITNVTETKIVKLSATRRPYRKLKGGTLLQISPVKVPRVIGKQGSMITMIKKETDCEIVVGQNGWIWVKGTPEKEAMVAKIIEVIEKEAHTKGLTDKIKAMLEEIKND